MCDAVLDILQRYLCRLKPSSLPILILHKAKATSSTASHKEKTYYEFSILTKLRHDPCLQQKVGCISVRC